MLRQQRVEASSIFVPCHRLYPSLVIMQMGYCDRPCAVYASSGQRPIWVCRVALSLPQSLIRVLLWLYSLGPGPTMTRLPSDRPRIRLTHSLNKLGIKATVQHITGARYRPTSLPRGFMHYNRLSRYLLEITPCYQCAALSQCISHIRTESTRPRRKRNKEYHMERVCV